MPVNKYQATAAATEQPGAEMVLPVPVPPGRAVTAFPDSAGFLKRESGWLPDYGQGVCVTQTQQLTRHNLAPRQVCHRDTSKCRDQYPALPHSTGCATRQRTVGTTLAGNEMQLPSIFPPPQPAVCGDYLRHQAASATEELLRNYPKTRLARQPITLLLFSLALRSTPGRDSHPIASTPADKVQKAVQPRQSSRLCCWPTHAHDPVAVGSGWPVRASGAAIRRYRTDRAVSPSVNAEASHRLEDAGQASDSHWQDRATADLLPEPGPARYADDSADSRANLSQQTIDLNGEQYHHG